MRIACSIALFALASSIDAPSSSAPVANDVMMFHFDELPPAGIFDDKSSIDANGACANAAVCPGVGGTGLRGTPRNSNVKRAADFNGTTDCITIPDHPAHSFNLNNGITFSAWILPRSLPGAGRAVAIVSKYSTGGNQREWILGIQNVSGDPHLAFWKSREGTSSSTTAVYSDRVLQTSDLNRWTHVVLRINSASRYQWWMNGSLVGAGVLADSLFKAGTATTRIGCVERSALAPDMLFHGKIDELLVAKSYISDTDLQAQYAWSRPQTPTMAYVAGIGTVPPGMVGSLLLANGRVDVPALAARIGHLRPDVYRFVIRRNRRCAESCNDFEALGRLLQTLSGSGAFTKVIVERDPLWYTIEPTGAPAECLTELSNEAVWGCAIGALAALHPNRLVGWSIDDFFSQHDGPAGPKGSFLDRKHAVNASRALHARAPDLPVYATIYCNAPIVDSTYIDSATHRAYDVRLYHEMSWYDSASLTYDRAMFDFLTRAGGDGVDPAELRGFITGVNVYLNQRYWDPNIPKQTTINRCLDGLRRLQVSRSFTINEGVYVTLAARPPMTCTERRSNVDAARLTVPDGYVFYEMLSLQESPELPCSAAEYDYSSLRTKTQRASTFVRW
jgi:hypothetical protein